MSCCGRTTSSRTTCFLKILLPASPSIGRQKRRFRGLTLPITDAIQSRRKTLDWFHVLRGGVGLVYMEISWCLIRTPAWSPHRVTESDIIYPDSMPLHTPDYSVCIQNQTKFYRKTKLQKKKPHSCKGDERILTDYSIACRLCAPPSHAKPGERVHTCVALVLPITHVGSIMR